MKINITNPQFSKEELQAVKEVLDSGWVVQGPKVAAFEQKICQYTKAPFAIATSSCTTGLHIALRALDIKSSDEVIVPAFTFVASANACEYVGAKPVFVDISLKTFNIAIEQIEKKITKKTKAIMPVHLFGLAVEMTEICKIARKYQLKIIEDGACALGTNYENKHVGLWGDFGVFSFHPRKAITTGEGGMIITQKKNLAEKSFSLRNHGAAISDFARHEKAGAGMSEVNILGYNYRMTDIQAAIGVVQMTKLKEILGRRANKANIYNQAFQNHPFLRTPITPSYSNHAYQSYVLLVRENSPLTRDEISLHLAKAGIATRQGTQNVPLLGFYCKKYGYKKQDFPCATSAEANTLTIPLYAQMTKKEQDYVISEILKLFNQ